MPFYKITVILKDKSVHTGIRELQTNDIDHAWKLYKQRCIEHYGASKIEDYNCVQVSIHSPDYARYRDNKRQEKFNYWKKK